VLPGNVTAYTDAPIYARTDGYLVRWYYDIGAQVKKGALLATIDTPELDKQVAQAEADLATAQANANNAKAFRPSATRDWSSPTRFRSRTPTLCEPGRGHRSAVKSAQANLQRLKELQSFEKVYAPFDGVVTARAVDTGQLINQGSGAELFHMQAIKRCACIRMCRSFTRRRSSAA
jgi:multidrug efflux pump subunit AcrA (membrane-fusion protein)